MKFLFRFFTLALILGFGFLIGYLGAVYNINEQRMQECLIIEKKLQQYVYLQMDLSKPLNKQKRVHFPDSLDALGPVYGKIFGISYEIDKDKFYYEPSLTGERYSLGVGLSYGKKYNSPRSI